ncbi:hypothetical protein J6590_031901 [Homalodisca vitripennis]|nr:hypothetical protein J6590_031901 [Homalodisca vitripennis]
MYVPRTSDQWSVVELEEASVGGKTPSTDESSPWVESITHRVKRQSQREQNQRYHPPLSPQTIGAVSSSPSYAYNNYPPLYMFLPARRTDNEYKHPPLYPALITRYGAQLRDRWGEEGNRHPHPHPQPLRQRSTAPSGDNCHLDQCDTSLNKTFPLMKRFPFSRQEQEYSRRQNNHMSARDGNFHSSFEREVAIL